MRCKKHPADLSSSVGVCASCLRELLSAIIEAQALKCTQQDCRKSDSLPPHLSFPGSVSPHISQRKSNTTTTTWQSHGHRRFYNTPQVGANGSITVEIKSSKNKKGGKFSSMILGFLRSKSDNKADIESGPISDPGVSVHSCSASQSWFSNIIPGSRKKKIMTFSIDERTCPNRGRGMSPPRRGDNEDEHCQSSGYSSDSQGWRQTPSRTPVSARLGGGRAAAHSKSVSGLAFCWSPLVRPSPKRHWSHKGVPLEMLVAGESRITPKPNLSTAASFCKNRS